MFLARLLVNGKVRVGVAERDAVLLTPVGTAFSELLFAESPQEACNRAAASATESVPIASAHFLAPTEGQEVWAAGVTYRRSREARMAESEQSATCYDRVYEADRPELFFKATSRRVVGPGQPVRIRSDSRWTVPEPELVLAIDPRMRLVGFTIGNDMSARDIEGANPLYLPQAKIYRGSAAAGPWIALAETIPDILQSTIEMRIERAGRVIFEGSTGVGRLKRRVDELISWLGRCNDFPEGALLFTGTGIVPPDEFSIAAGDNVRIRIDGIGELFNPVESAV